MRHSYSQCGEDCIIAHYLGSVTQGRYVDVGAHHPTDLNNTYYFYEQGWRGILVEPLPYRCAELRERRPGDEVLQCAVGSGTSAKLTLFGVDTLSTLCRREEYIAQGERPLSIIDVEVRSLAQILRMQPETDLLSIDVEGAEMDVLQSHHWELNRPKVIILEVKAYGSNTRYMTGVHYLESKGYLMLADTFINVIMCLPKIKR